MPSTFNPPMSIGEFIDEQSLSMRCEPTRATKRQAATDWGRRASHWACVFRINSLGYRRRKFVTRFSQGSAVLGLPSIDEVLGYMARDYGDLERAGYDFDRWREEAGWEDAEDLKEARRIFDNVSRDAKRFRDFIGDDNYTKFLNETDPA